MIWLRILRRRLSVYRLRVCQGRESLLPIDNVGISRSLLLDQDNATEPQSPAAGVDVVTGEVGERSTAPTVTDQRDPVGTVTDPRDTP